MYDQFLKHYKACKTKKHVKRLLQNMNKGKYSLTRDNFLIVAYWTGLGCMRFEEFSALLATAMKNGMFTNK